MNFASSNSVPSDNSRHSTAAAEWLIKRDRGLTAAEQDEYFQWLAADPRHGEWLARHETTWRELNALAQWRPEHSLVPNPDLLAPPRGRRRWLKPVWFVTLAAAAGVAVAFLYTDRSRTAVVSGTPASQVAAAYERQVLPDGSVIQLNRGAEVAVEFTAAERRVQLRQGEALFTVAKNPARPFIVDAAGVKVRAVGTAFNVRLTANAVEVIVTEGHVQVRPPALIPGLTAGEALLAAGQRTIVARSALAALPQVTDVPPEEIDRILAWRPRLLNFDSVPLCDVAVAFNRSNRVKLVIADPSLNLLPIVASFRSDNVEGFVRLLEATTDVRADRKGDTIELYRAR